MNYQTATAAPSPSSYYTIDATNARIIENFKRFMQQLPLTEKQLKECKNDIKARIAKYNVEHPNEPLTEFNDYFYNLCIDEAFIVTHYDNVLIERFKLGFILLIGGGYYTIPKLSNVVIPMTTSIVELAINYATDTPAVADVAN
jgi:hypothetical protein